MKSDIIKNSKQMTYAKADADVTLVTKRNNPVNLINFLDIFNVMSETERRHNTSIDILLFIDLEFSHFVEIFFTVTFTNIYLCIIIKLISYI